MGLDTARGVERVGEVCLGGPNFCLDVVGKYFVEGPTLEEKNQIS